MSRREDIDNAIWSDPDFATLTPNAKLIYLWSFTNERCNMSGLYKVSAKAAGFDTGLPQNAVERAFVELREASFVYLDDGVLWVRSRVKHLRSRGDAMAKSIRNDLAKLRPDHPLLHAFVACYQADPWLEHWVSKVTLVDPLSTLYGTSIEVPGQGQRQRSSRTTVEGEDDARARELCELLSTSCREITQTPPSSRKYSVTPEWLIDMDRLVRLDGREPEKVTAAIQWAHKDSFWRKVILSPRKLRQHYDALRLAYSQPAQFGRSKAERGADGVAAITRLMEGHAA